MKETVQTTKVSPEEAIQIDELIQLIQLEYSKADRAVQVVQMNAQAVGRKLDPMEIQQTRLQYEKTAEAYEMVLNHIVSRKIQNSSAAELARNLKIVEGEVNDTTDTATVKEVQKPKKEEIVQPKIVDKEMRKEAEKTINDLTIEDSIAEAARMAESKTTSEHWKIARDKVRHFYAGGDELSANPTDKQIDNFIREVCSRVSSRKQAEILENVGIEGIRRKTVKPVTSRAQANKMPARIKDQFNFEILGIGNTKTPEEKQDKIKLMIIREMSLGHVQRATAIAMNFFSEKKWTEFEASEFVKVLMNQDPHAELNEAIYNILKSTQDTEGNAKKAMKKCREIVGMYFGTKYATVKKGKTALDSLEEKNNKRIDRFINRQLDRITPKGK
jgi:hypothetical protein